MRRIRGLTKAGAAAFAICAVLGAGPTHANLLVNGDFNTGIPNHPGWTFIHGSAGETQERVFHRGTSAPAFPGFWFNAGTAAENGPGIVAFNAGDTLATGSILQTFGTVPGAEYTVEFDYGVTGMVPNSMQSLGVTILGSNGVTVLFTDVVFDSNNHTDPGDNSLTGHVFVFTADGGQATIRFSDVLANVTPSIDGVLDNVSVDGPAPAPEPAALALVGLALAGLGLGRVRPATKST